MKDDSIKTDVSEHPAIELPDEAPPKASNAEQVLSSWSSEDKQLITRILEIVVGIQNVYSVLLGVTLYPVTLWLLMSYLSGHFLGVRQLWFCRHDILIPKEYLIESPWFFAILALYLAPALKPIIQAMAEVITGVGKIIFNKKD